MITALPFGLKAQEAPAESQDTKIIIIEEKVDRWGNKTVTKTVKDGNFTDAEIEKIIEAESVVTAEEPKKKGYLGVMIENAEAGVRITEVLEDSPAASAGLQAGDVITSIGETPVTGMEGLVQAVSTHAPGEAVTVSYLRDGTAATTTATLSERSEPAVSDVFGWDEDVRERRQLEREEMLRHREHEMKEKEEMHRQHKMDMQKHEEMMRKHEMEMEKHLEKEKKPRFGVYLDEVEAGPGVRVTRVSEGSIAAAAGVQEGDVITSFNKQEVNSADDLIEAVQNAPADKKVKVELIRAGKKVKEKVVFEEA